ncbi:MAG: DUF3035 domain-containing protein, partial [Rhizobiales bacterium]|nr:DUF3035 domain-containing protein [Hyphomicrobiales bacterium]
MNEMKGTALSLAVLLVLGACTETQFADTLGVGKTAPDESQIRVNQALSMPPDLRLKQPTGEITEYGTPNKAAAVTTTTHTVSAAPDDVEETATDEPVMTASTDPVAAPKTTTTKTAEASATAANTAAEAQKPATIDDAYARYGISKTYPNGKPKPTGVLYDE